LLVAMAGGRCRTEQGDMRPSIHAVGTMIDRTESAIRRWEKNLSDYVP
jgi:hypothetical protein